MLRLFIAVPFLVLQRKNKRKRVHSIILITNSLEYKYVTSLTQLYIISDIM